jgi:tRNA(Leu) C34 or U34 (ribose-2'-O)-methylase TrmL
VGGVVRACASFGIPTLRWTGDRVRMDDPSRRLPREERMRGYQTVDFARSDGRVLDDFSDVAVPIAVEFRANAERLPEFIHPPGAVYVFGPEDGHLPQGILTCCHRFVVVPSVHCLNLAAAVNVVLYDRRTKLGWEGVQPVYASGGRR